MEKEIPFGSGVGLTNEVEEDNSKIFPQKLMDILNEPSNQDAIHWLPHGRSFIISDREKFAHEILPRYFRKTKYTSFTRKLNRWNFQRVTRGPEMGSYHHEFFRRGNEALCIQMYCKNDRAKFAVTSGDDLPVESLMSDPQKQKQQQQQQPPSAKPKLPPPPRQQITPTTLPAFGAARSRHFQDQQQQQLSMLAAMQLMAKPDAVPTVNAAAQTATRSMLLQNATNTNLQRQQQQRRLIPPAVLGMMPAQSLTPEAVFLQMQLAAVQAQQQQQQNQQQQLQLQQQQQQQNQTSTQTSPPERQRPKQRRSLNNYRASAA